MMIIVISDHSEDSNKLNLHINICYFALF